MFEHTWQGNVSQSTTYFPTPSANDMALAIQMSLKSMKRLDRYWLELRRSPARNWKTEYTPAGYVEGEV